MPSAREWAEEAYRLQRIADARRVKETRRVPLRRWAYEAACLAALAVTIVGSVLWAVGVFR